MATRAMKAQVYGIVQGVGFRYYTQMEASRLGVTGWVRNRRDGSVEVHAEGEDNAMQAFQAYLHDGPPSARVQRVQIRDVQPENSHITFVVR